MTRRGVLAVWLSVLALGGCAVPFSVRHRVGPKEDLARIAARYGVSERELRDFNHLEAEDRVRLGDIVFVPGAGSPVQRPVARVPIAASPARMVERPPPAQPPAAHPPAATRARPAPPVRAPAPPPASPPPITRPQETARPTAAPRKGTGRFQWPAPGEVLRGFGIGPAGESRGIDLGLPQGTEVRAAAAGTVTYAGTPAEAYGPLVIVEHAGGFFTVYGNLAGCRVEKGQRIEAGATVGTAGGKHGDLPPHLHFEVREGQVAVDPLLFLPPR